MVFWLFSATFIILGLSICWLRRDTVLSLVLSPKIASKERRIICADGDMHQKRPSIFHEQKNNWFFWTRRNSALLTPFNPSIPNFRRPAFATFESLANDGEGRHEGGKSYVINAFQGFPGTESLVTAESDEENDNDMAEHQDTGTQGLDGILTTPNNIYSIRIDNVPIYRSYEIAGSHAFEDLLHLNALTFSREQLWCIEWLTKAGTTYRDGSVLLIHLTDAIAMRGLLQYGLTITEGAEPLTAIEYIVPLTQCSHCTRFNCLYLTCKTEAPSCGVCGGPHHTHELSCCTAASQCFSPLECSHAIRCCALCGGKHSALDAAARCPARMRAVEMDIGARI